MIRNALFILALSGVAMTSVALASGGASLERGKALFNDAGLAHSSNGRSCSSCHAGGAKLENANRNPDLAGQINRCIKGALNGKPLDKNSSDMRSLVMYVQSLADKQKTR